VLPLATGCLACSVICCRQHVAAAMCCAA
jgi:hypothetical protein